ncbi:hypothetical protein FQN60_002411 [Etheostoma spectabile]|uniref:SAP domain-containing protein n=1 Tax=Etheostoma spectabile TaxID=54343 RepID=A0A5J5D9Y0_9PERO|nr:hypothetical protein FQN60_002411 [Etheostoma spectabile]
MAEVIELQKLKLAELRQECEARGLDTKGNKGELIARLQAYLEEHDLLIRKWFGDSTENTSPAPGGVANSKATIEEDEKLKKRKERFGVTAAAGVAVSADVEAKKMKRAERFGKSE